VLNREQERIYLEFVPQPLHDVAMLMLDTALGPAEALALMWRDIYFEASAESPFGYMQVREGKTRYRARSVSLTSRVHSMLRERKRDSESDFVFAQGIVSLFCHLPLLTCTPRFAPGARAIFVRAHGADAPGGGRG
jgi:integrase